MNNIIMNNAVNSFLKFKDNSFIDSNGEFDAPEYIKTLVENCKKDGRIILDFYHDICDENDELVGGYIDYCFFKFATANINIVFLVNHIRNQYNEFAEIAENNKSVEVGNTVLSVYVARINKLISINTPKIIINTEKKYLLHHVIANSIYFELVEKVDFLPNPDSL